MKHIDFFENVSLFLRFYLMLAFIAFSNNS